MNITKLVSLNNIYKSYYNKKEEIKVLNDISFDIHKNDFIAIIGPSGCGKSSILNLLSSLDNNYKGTISIKENTTIGYMLQEDALFNWLTIYENAILGLKIKKILTKENIEYVNTLLKKYDLYTFKNNYPNELSGGMKKRLSLIRTLAIKPDILLLDEAFSALDYQTKMNVIKDVYNILKEENKTLVMVTHDINEALYMCSKIIVLSKRPSNIKKVFTIKFDNNGIDEKRKSKLFPYYYDLIWKEIDNVN